MEGLESCENAARDGFVGIAWLEGRRILIEFEQDVQSLDRPRERHICNIQRIEDRGAQFVLHHRFERRVFHVRMAQEACGNPEGFPV